MTRTFDDAFASWLEAGPTRASDHVLEALRADVARTPQRRRSRLRPPAGAGPSRFMALAAVAAAAVTVLLVGLSAIGGRFAGVGGPPPPSATPTMVGSRYVNDFFRVPFTVTLPESWSVVMNDTSMFAALRPTAEGAATPQAGIDVTMVWNVTSDPCSGTEVAKFPALGSSPEELVQWMTGFEPLRASEPVPVTLAGVDAVRIDENFVATTDCPFLQMWSTPGGYVEEPERKHFYVFEIDGQRVVAVSISRDDGTPADEAEADAVLQTLSFE